jgi:hypothetical protein
MPERAEGAEHTTVSSDVAPVNDPRSPRSSRPDEHVERRRQKLHAWQSAAHGGSAGGSAGGLQYRFEVDKSASGLVSAYGDLPAGARTDDVVRVAGRLVLLRRHGGLSFGVLRDRTGTVQIFVDRGALGEQVYRNFLDLDRGDWIGVCGVVMRTDKGELSVAVISQEWRGKEPERGAPGGFLRIVPAYGEDFGYTLDLMRHRPAAPNGMTEYLIAHTALVLGAEGVVRLSMDFAMWGKLYEERVEYSLAERVAKRGVDVLNPFFQIKSLHDFNAKFSPQWLSRMLVFEELTDLPRVGLLYAGAEGFLSLPGVGGLFVPKAVGGVPAEDDASGRPGRRAA